MDVLEGLYNEIMSPQVSALNSVFKLVLSLVLGCMIGYERKRMGQMAGVRTFALISMGAAIAMILSMHVAEAYYVVGDPARIAAQVISGIGFLGAGAIIQMKGSVRGLTTAAGIWVSAAIGMVVGAGLYSLAVIATVCVLFVLSLLEVYEQKVNFAWATKVVRVELKGVIKSSQEYISVFEQCGMHVNDTYLKFDYSKDRTVANFVVLTRTRTDFSELFEKLRTLNDTLSITLTNEINN